MDVPQKNFLGAGLLAVAFFLFWVFVVPGYQDATALRTAIGERQDIMTERTALIQRVAQLKSEYDARAADIRTFSAVVPPEKSIAEIVSSLEQIAQTTGVQMTDLNVVQDKSESSREGRGVVNITVQGSGYYSSLVGFLRSFEQNVRLIDVETLDVGQNKALPDLLIFSIKATAYSLK